MRWFWSTFTSVVIGGLLSLAPAASAQQPAPKQQPPATMAPAQRSMSPAPMASAPSGQQPGQRVIVVEPIRVFDPFFEYPYPYAYEPDYMAANFGYVKIKTDHKDAAVYVDGGFADKIEKAHKFALRPGTHEVELRDSDGRTLFHERVAVIVGKTTELHAG